MSSRLIIAGDTHDIDERLTKEERRLKSMNRPSLIMPSTLAPDIEEALISACLHSPYEFGCIGELSGGDFQNPWMGKIFDFLKLSWGAGQAIRDPALLCNWLQSKNDFPDGYRKPAFVGQLLHAGLVASSGYYADLIRAKKYDDQVKRLADTFQKRVWNSEIPLYNTMAWLKEMLRRLDSTTDDPRPIGDVAKQVIAELSQDSERRATAHAVWPGLASVNQRTGAFHPGELLVLSGYTGGGKTSFAIQMAVDAASKNQQVLALSMEMRAIELATRLLAQQAGVDGRHIRNDILSGDDLDRMRQVADEIAHYPLKLCERGKTDWDIARVEALARFESYRSGLRLLVIDYLTLLDLRDPSRPKQETREQIDEAVRRLKTLAQELECVILLLVQLNRESQKNGAEPELWHLADSAAIERHADCVMLVYQDPQEPTAAFLKIAKNRNGPKGKVKLGWNQHLTQFTDG